MATNIKIKSYGKMKKMILL